MSLYGATVAIWSRSTDMITVTCDAYKHVMSHVSTVSYLSHPGSRIFSSVGAADISSATVPLSIILVEDAEAPCLGIPAVHIGRCHRGSIKYVE